MRSPEYREEKKKEIMMKCFECYCDNGAARYGNKGTWKILRHDLGKSVRYFDNVDDLITQSTEYCMAKVEDDFMELAPKNPEDILRFIEEIPYWTAQKHGKKYRLMYQVYMHPKYIEHGKKFVEGVSRRYTEYAQRLSPILGIPEDILRGFIFLFVRASVHYALFEDKYYLESEMKALKLSVFAVLKENKNNNMEELEAML